MVAAGLWRPTAVLDGVELLLTSLDVKANGRVARFAACRPDDSSDAWPATFSLPGIGTTTASGNVVRTLRCLAGYSNGLAL